MVSLKKLLPCFLSLIIMLVGCNIDEKSTLDKIDATKSTKNDLITSPNSSLQRDEDSTKCEKDIGSINTAFYDFHIQPPQLDWITLKSEFDDTRFKIVCPDIDSTTATKILKWITPVLDILHSQEEASLEVLNIHRSYTNYLQVQLLNGNSIIVRLYNTCKTDQKGIMSIVPVEDTVVVQLHMTGGDKFYKVISKELFNYLVNESLYDMPSVKALTFTPDKETYEEGSSIVISGDGCISKKVKLYLIDNNNSRYLLRSVEPLHGKWEIKFDASRTLKVSNDIITLQPGTYSFCIEMDELTFSQKFLTIH